MLRNLKIYILRLDINQILKMGFQLRYKWLDHFPSLFIFKVCVYYYFKFHQNKTLKKLRKMFLVSPELLFWFLLYSGFMWKVESLKWNNYDIIKCIL